MTFVLDGRIIQVVTHSLLALLRGAAGKKETRTVGWDLMGKDVNISESFEQPVPAPETNDG